MKFKISQKFLKKVFKLAYSIFMVMKCNFQSNIIMNSLRYRLFICRENSTYIHNIPFSYGKHLIWKNSERFLEKIFYKSFIIQKASRKLLKISYQDIILRFFAFTYDFFLNLNRIFFNPWYASKHFEFF